MTYDQRRPSQLFNITFSEGQKISSRNLACNEGQRWWQASKKMKAELKCECLSGNEFENMKNNKKINSLNQFHPIDLLYPNNSPQTLSQKTQPTQCQNMGEERRQSECDEEQKVWENGESLGETKSAIVNSVKGLLDRVISHKQQYTQQVSNLHSNHEELDQFCELPKLSPDYEQQTLKKKQTLSFQKGQYNPLETISELPAKAIHNSQIEQDKILSNPHLSFETELDKTQGGCLPFLNCLNNVSISYPDLSLGKKSESDSFRNSDLKILDKKVKNKHVKYLWLIGETTRWVTIRETFNQLFLIFQRQAKRNTRQMHQILTHSPIQFHKLKSTIQSKFELLNTKHEHQIRNLNQHTKSTCYFNNESLSNNYSEKQRKQLFKIECLSKIFEFEKRFTVMNQKQLMRIEMSFDIDGDYMPTLKEIHSIWLGILKDFEEVGHLQNGDRALNEEWLCETLLDERIERVNQQYLLDVIGSNESSNVCTVVNHCMKLMTVPKTHRHNLAKLRSQHKVEIITREQFDAAVKDYKRKKDHQLERQQIKLKGRKHAYLEEELFFDEDEDCK